MARREKNKGEDRDPAARVARRQENRQARRKSRQANKSARTGAIDRLQKSRKQAGGLGGAGAAAAKKFKASKNPVSKKRPVSKPKKQPVQRKTTPPVRQEVKPPQTLPPAAVDPQAGTALQPGQVMPANPVAPAPAPAPAQIQPATPVAPAPQPAQIQPATPVAPAPAPAPALAPPQAQIQPAVAVDPQQQNILGGATPALNPTYGAGGEFDQVAGQAYDQSIAPAFQPTVDAQDQVAQFGEAGLGPAPAATPEEAVAQVQIDQAQAEGKQHSLQPAPMPAPEQFYNGQPRPGTPGQPQNPRDVERLRRKRLALLTPSQQQLRPWGRGLPQIRYQGGPAFDGALQQQPQSRQLGVQRPELA